MAKTGIKKVYVGKWSAEGTYSEGKKLGTTAGFNGNPNANDAVDYGDNGAQETDKSVTGGTVSLEQNELTLEEKSMLLGHQMDVSKKELVYDVNDVAPYVGIGAIGTSRRSGANVFVGKFYKKVQFGEPNDENSTKQETTTFGHDSIEGTILIPEDGIWKEEGEFKKEAEAEARLKKKVGITA